MSSGREGKKREERGEKLKFSLLIRHLPSKFTAFHFDPSSVEEVSLFCSEQREVENG